MVKLDFARFHPFYESNVLKSGSICKFQVLAKGNFFKDFYHDSKRVKPLLKNWKTARVKI